MTNVSTAVGQETEPQGTFPAAGVYQVDKAHSVVSFVVRHAMVSKVRGHFNEFEATIVIGADEASSKVDAVVDIASIDTRDPNRDNHLRSSDFFELDRYPKMTFSSRKIMRTSDGLSLEGDLTIKATTKPVVFQLEYNGATTDPNFGTRIGFSAWTEIDREDFDLAYNMVLEAGGVVIGKRVRIELEIEAVQEPKEDAA